MVSCKRLHLFILVCIAAGAAAAPSTSQSGYLTFYGGPASIPVGSKIGGGLVSGACGYGMLKAADWPYNQVVALGPNNTLANAIGTNKLGCGQCVLATCSSSNCAANSTGGAVLLVTDNCPTCDDNQLNVPASVFLEHFGSSLSLGRVNLTYHQVDCDPPGDIRIKVVQANADDGGYIAIAFLSLLGSGNLGGVDVKTSGSRTWGAMINSYGNVWQAANFGAPPLDIRITNADGETVVALGAITNITNSTFLTKAQFGRPGEAPAPAPTTVLDVLKRTMAMAPNAVNPPTSITVGVRVNSPLYFAPLDGVSLGAFPDITFTYTECFEGAPILNMTVDRMLVPTQDGTTTLAWAIHSLAYRLFHSERNESMYQLVDYSYYNLESGEFVQLYEAEYVNFRNASYDGTVPVDDYEADEVVYPQFVDLASSGQPADFEYAVLLPPGPNEVATAAYLRALKVMYYYTTVITLGNSGGVDHITCSEGLSVMGPWADYLRSVIAQVAPPRDIVGDLYDNIPLGSDYAFQGSSLVIKNALVLGNVVSSSKQLSVQDCGAGCTPPTSALTRSSPVCSAWNYCGAISGCASVPYQTCQLLNSTETNNLTAPNGFLNIAKNSGVRFTTGVLALPPPKGLSLFVVQSNSSRTGYGVQTNVAFGPAIVP